MKSMLSKYVLIGFLLSSSLFLFLGALGKKADVGRYRLYTEMEGQVIYVLDTQTGTFNSYVANSMKNQGGLDLFTYFLADNIGTDMATPEIKKEEKKTVETLISESAKNYFDFDWLLKEYEEELNIFQYVPNETQILSSERNEYKYMLKDGTKEKVFFVHKTFKEDENLIYRTYVAKEKM